MERKSRGGKTGNDAKASAGTQICPNCKKLFKRLGQHRCQLSSATTPVKKEKKLDAKKTDTKASVERQRDRETRAKTAEEQRFDGQRSALTTRLQHEGSINSDSQGGARPKVNAGQPLSIPPLSSTERRGSKRNPKPPSNPLRGSHGREPVLDVTALTEEAEEVMEKLKLEANPNPVHYNTTFFDDQVKVKRHEKEAVLGAFNPFRGRIKRSLNESTEWKWKDFNSGSTYDGTKVCITDYCLLLL